MPISVIDRVVDRQAPAKVIAKVNEWIDQNEDAILALWENGTAWRKNRKT